MGNSKQGRKLRPKNQPSKLLLSGDNTAIAVGGKSGNNSTNEYIDIRLVQLDLGVAAQIKIGDFVQLHWNGTNYEVYFDSQRLGNVPGNYEKILLPKVDYKGRLVRVVIYVDPIDVVVRLRLSPDQL
ncbi:hypothetical protein [Arsenicibacter rosenii]|uniref:Uncharacterized protein n=1 Tax=Arsenicibacter rosenii TaxID=1750698 RepID=A0A1S2VC21_9BACT|nr:hypothetical protein [Arsenicibacter rosenii]OIN55776.1 hypothetical protein BLX24_28205 [Arsenicibacter rosenii]